MNVKKLRHLYSKISRLALGPIPPPLQGAPKVKLPERETDHSLPRSIDVKNKWNYTSVPPTCLYRVDSASFTLYLYKRAQTLHATERTVDLPPCMYHLYEEYKLEEPRAPILTFYLQN